jgi:hypothetical protein
MCIRLAARAAAWGVFPFSAVSASPAGAQDREVLIDSCADVSAWGLNLGAEFPGADGQVAGGSGRPVSADSQRGQCLRLSYDFTGGGNYVTASRGIDIPAPAAKPAASAVSFWVRQEGANWGFVRICDATEQEHAGGFKIEGAGWQKISLPFDEKTFAGHWHGRNDGKFYFPLQTIIIGVSHGATARGTLALADLAFSSSDARLFYAVAMRTADPGNIAFTSPGSVAVDVTLANRLDEPCELTLRVGAEDWYGQKRPLLEAKVACQPRAAVQRKLSLDGRRPSYYLLTAEVLRDGKVVAQGQDAVVVTPRPQNFGVDDPQSFFALQQTTEGARTERLGVKWVRAGRDWRWGEMNAALGAPTGKYTIGDLNAIRRNHQLIMYTMSAYPPQWAERLAGDEPFWEGPGAEQRLQWWARYVEHSARTLADQVDTFEIQNEPDLTCMGQVGLKFDAGVERYLKILRTGAAAVRQGAPRANVAGIDVSGGDYDGGLKFSDATMARAGNLIDIYTGHPYAGVRYFGPGLQPMWPVKNEERRKCLDTLAMIRRYGGKQRFWIGEKGWGLDVKADPLSTYSRDFACCLVQSLVIAHSVPSVERYFWFLEEGCNEGGYEYGLFRGGRPLPAALAYSTLAYLLHHAQPLASPAVGGFVQAHCFVSKDTGDGTLVLWSEGEKARLAVERMPARWSALNLMGGRLASGDKGGALRVALDRSPVYVRFPSSAARAVCEALAHAAVSLAEPLKLEVAYIGHTDRISARVRNLTAQTQSGVVEALGRKQPISLKPGERRVVELPMPASPLRTRQRDFRD